MSATTLGPAGSLIRRGIGMATLRRPRRARSSVVVALVVLVAGFAGLLVTHSSPRLPVARARALALLRRDPAARRLMALARVDHVGVLALDQHFDQVFGYRGQRAVFTADVSVHGHVVAQMRLEGHDFAFGSATANSPAVLVLLTLVFLLATGVWPLRRLRNLDAVVAASLGSSVFLFDHMYLTWMVLAAVPALAYLAARCAWRALGPARPPAPATPLLEWLTRGWSPERRLRLLRLVAAAAGLIVLMVSYSSLHVIDVGLAVMEGATLILHGILPYGHIPDVLHGDTYPFGSYLLFTPFAWIKPVHDAWGDADETLAVAAVSALAGAWLLARTLRRAPRAERTAASAGAAARAQARERAGLRAAIAWLTFPCLLVTASTGTTDVTLGVLVLGALLLWRRPALATTALAAGAWFKLAPAALLPLSLARARGRGLLLGLLGAGAITAVMVGIVVALGGAPGVGEMLHAMAFQQTRSSPESLWSQIGSVPLQQLAEALTAALIAGAAWRLRADRALARDRGRMAALFAAVLLGLQICANYWSCLYLAWIVPLLCFALWAEPDPAQR